MADNLNRLKVVILAAGAGSRLGTSLPKPLTQLKSGCSILHRQLKNISQYVDKEEVIIVVGYKKELIMEAFPFNTYVYNDRYATTNTAKSLLRALKKCEECDVLWMNGDVVFQAGAIRELLVKDQNAMAVIPGKVDEEGIKYKTVNGDQIIKVSKEVVDGEGEAVGINLIKKEDIALFIQCLERCQDHDYFEKGIELAIEKGLSIHAVNVSEYHCIEVDFLEDLTKVNQIFGA